MFDDMSVCKKWSAVAFFLLIFVLLAQGCQAQSVSIVISGQASDPERIAGDELEQMLSKLYPNQRFTVTAEDSGASFSILVGTPRSLPQMRDYVPESELEGDESFVVKNTARNGRRIGVIAGKTGRGVLYGIYQLLEKLGCGFYLTGDTLQKSRNQFSFEGWDLRNRPLVEDRVVFNWHNFLSGCTGWDKRHWLSWVTQSQKMGYNTIMVHAYGNNPMFTFSFNGIEKPVGYVGTTKRGRDWGNQHINDVRRMPGGEIFKSAEFGSEAALVGDNEGIEAKQKMMKSVFSFAEKRGMRVCFALDVDIESMLPQEMIESIAESDRIHNGRIWLPRPDIWLPRPDRKGGYEFYKAQVKALIGLYPEIDLLAIWRRNHGAEWGRFKKAEQLPEEWREEYDAYIRQKPAAGKLEQSVCSFALSKVVGAFRKALKEIGRSDIRICTGSWGTNWIPSVAEFFDEEVTIMPLDSSCMVRYRGGSYFYRGDHFADLFKAKGRIVPIIWAHHDDGEYIGRPLHPHKGFHDTLSKLEAGGYGIIHWMNRPLDLYFRNHSSQVWAATQNEPYRRTCKDMAQRYFGGEQSGILGDYLYRWAMDAPIFGRVTSNHFFLRDEYIPNPEQAVQACRKRLRMLESIETSRMTKAQKERVRYFKALENVIVSFCRVQEFSYRPARSAIQSGQFTKARSLLERADPAETMREFSRLSQIGGGDRGEEAMVISLGTRWLTDYISARQATGLEGIRINYGPTYFEPLAQGAGSYAFHIDKEGRYWSVRGNKETKQAVITHGSDVALSVSGDSSESIEEIVQTGIVVDSPATLAVSPVVNLYRRLAPGNYRLTIYAGPAAGSDQCKVRFATEQQSRTKIRVKAAKGRLLRIACKGSNANRWNSIYEIALNALNRESLDQVRASARAAGHPASAAVDGDAGTRWAAEGNHWIQIPLDPTVEFEEMEISWYEGSARDYRYALQVSDDGEVWRELEIEPVSKHAGDQVHVLRNSGQSDVTVTIIEKEIHLERPLLPQLHVVPEEEKVVVYGLRLRATSLK
ncbi:MAG: discoidin domain-containing protein [Planctomycetota bacterium]